MTKRNKRWLDFASAVAANRIVVPGETRSTPANPVVFQEWRQRGLDQELAAKVAKLGTPAEVNEIGLSVLRRRLHTMQAADEIDKVLAVL